MQESNFIHITAGITQVTEAEEELLSCLPAEATTQRRNRQNRAVKQILGHLIDSVSNNYQRVTRLQRSEDLFFFPDYAQDNGLRIVLQDYQNTDWSNLVQLWKYCNLHIIQVINSADKNRLDSYWCDSIGARVILREMIEGYLGHLHLHIKEIHELID